MKKYKFSELFEFQKKSKIKAGAGLSRARFPFFTSSNILSKYYNISQFDSPSLIFGTGGNASVHFSETPFSVSTDCLVAQLQLEIKQKAITRFAYYYLSGNIWILKRGFKGAGLKHISKKYINNIEIPLPPLEDQKQIVRILDQADDLRQKRKKAIGLLDEYLKSVFLEMFGDPERNPHKNDVVTVADITTHIKDGPHVSPKYAEKGIPILSTRNIRPGKLVLEDLKYVSQDTFMKLTRIFCPKKGDVLLTKGGTTGYAKVVDFDWLFCVWVHIAILRPISEIDPIYLEGAMNSDYCYRQSQRFTHGIANRDLGLKRIAKIKLLNPPTIEQQKYALIVKRVQKIKQKMLTQSKELDIQFQALMQRAFKGELCEKKQISQKFKQNYSLKT